MAPKTLPPKHPATLETLIFVRSTSGHSYDATLAASRKAIMEDLHRIPIAKIDDMLAAMFPQVDSTLARAVVDKLKSSGDINTQGGKPSTRNPQNRKAPKTVCTIEVFSILSVRS
jgi:hypothetical protein